MTPSDKQTVSELLQFFEHYMLLIVQHAAGKATKSDVFNARAALIEAFDRADKKR